MNAAEFLSSLRRTPIASAPPGAEELYSAGHWLLSEDRPADAAKVFRAMLLAAPTDERGWLGLGECHQRIDQPRIALEMYGTGSVIAPRSVRCHLARARVLRALGRDDEADLALDAAHTDAEERGDDELLALVALETRRTS
jgi:cytochrome c-type biogenesis protein CcmH/NrfG